MNYQTKEKVLEHRRAGREHIAQKVARIQESEPEKRQRYQEMAEHDEITKLGEFQDGSKRFSLHVDEYEGHPYYKLQKRVWNKKSGQWNYRQHLTFSPHEAADLLELVIQAREDAERSIEE